MHTEGDCSSIGTYCLKPAIGGGRISRTGSVTMSAANRRLTVLQQHLAQGEYGVSSDTLHVNPTRAEPSVWSHVPQASTVCLSASK